MDSFPAPEVLLGHKPKGFVQHKKEITTMKKVLSLLLTMIVIFLLVFTVTTGALADSGSTASGQPDLIAGLIDRGAEIVQTLVLAAIGIIGAWVSDKLTKTQHLKNVGAAWDEAVKAAKLTVGELKQRFVDDMKASSADGKLTEDEIAKLRKDLFKMAKDKMSQPAYDILLAAGVDVNALILGAGDAFIDEIKRGTFPEGTLLQGVVANE